LHTGIVKISIRGPVEHGVLEISGELDLSGAIDAVEVVAALPHRLVSIDLAGLEFVDIAGARAIERIRADRDERHGERPALIGVPSSVERTLSFVRTRDEAMLTR